MAKKIKAKKKPPKKTEIWGTRKAYLIIGVVALFLIILLLMNSLQSFKKIDTRTCVEHMVFLEEMMRTVKDELDYVFPENVATNEMVRTLAIYYMFGEKGFEQQAEGGWRVRTPEELRGIPPIRTLPFRELRCPAKGEYSLVSSRSSEVYDIACSQHGRLYQPDDQGNYQFDGNIFALSPMKSEAGWKVNLYLNPELRLNKEFVIIVPYLTAEGEQREPVQE